MELKFVAIVGPNGAGKTTLIKLLCRFYDPDAGRIEWDGSDYRSLDVDQLRSRISVLLQEPVHYNATVSENIAMGRPAGGAAGEAVVQAARDAGAESVVEKLPGGYQTLLGKWFEDGAELSVGEWQRLCLARAFYRDAALLLLDEPTSAMDSWAEADWMGRFRELARNRTALIITHRFTTAMRADIIHVMNEGRIIESGTHDELLALNGVYATSWKAQMNPSLD